MSEPENVEQLPVARSEPKEPIPLSRGVLDPRTFEDAWRMAQALSSSSLVPKDFQGQPANVLVAMQMGAELGLPPLQAMQNIAVINGRPSVWGDAALAIVIAAPVVRDVVEDPPTAENDWTARCTVFRLDREAVSRTFSLADAEAASLTGKAGPWKQYRNRMIAMRARGFALRDGCADILRGLAVAEEALDIPPQAVTVQPAGPSLEALNSEIAGEGSDGGPLPEPAQAPPRGAADEAPESTTEQAPASEAKAPAAEQSDPGCTHPASARIEHEGSVGCSDCGEILPEPSVGEVLNAMQRAESIDDLDAALDLARGLPNEKRVQVDKKAAQVRKRLGG